MSLLSPNADRKLNQKSFFNFKLIKPGLTNSTLSNSLKLFLINKDISDPISNGFFFKLKEKINEP